MRIIHVSDLHNESEALDNTDRLVRQYPDWDVVALTGDTANQTKPSALASLDRWPQSHLLAVPGNHDLPQTYTSLTRWTTVVPWVKPIGDTVFLGVNSCKPLDRALATAISEQLVSTHLSRCSLLVMLLHHPPGSTTLGELLGMLFGSPEVTPRLLVLHGHDHPASFTGTWSDTADLGGGWKAAVSHVCSCARGWRGAVHLITWNGTSLECMYGYAYQRRRRTNT